MRTTNKALVSLATIGYIGIAIVGAVMVIAQGDKAIASFCLGVAIGAGGTIMWAWSHSG